MSTLWRGLGYFENQFLAVWEQMEENVLFWKLRNQQNSLQAFNLAEGLYWMKLGLFEIAVLLTALPICGKLPPLGQSRSRTMQRHTHKGCMWGNAGSSHGSSHLQHIFCLGLAHRGLMQLSLRDTECYFLLFGKCGNQWKVGSQIKKTSVPRLSKHMLITQKYTSWLPEECFSGHGSRWFFQNHINITIL